MWNIMPSSEVSKHFINTLTVALTEESFLFSALKLGLEY